MSTCPDKTTLYAFMDGEVSSRTRLELDAHVRSCSACRDELRRMSRVQGALFGRDADDHGPEFEREFLGKLMDRMVTSREARQLRVRRGRLVGTATAAGVIAFCLGVWAWRHAAQVAPVDRPTQVVETSPATRSESVARLRRLDVLDGELDRLLLTWKNDLPAVRGRLGDLTARYRAAGADLGARLVGRLEDGLAPTLETVAAMGVLGEPSLLPAIRRVAAADGADSELRVALVTAAAAIGTAEACQIIAGEVRRGFPLRDAMQMLLDVGTEAAWSEVARLARERGATEPKLVAEVLGPRSGEAITDLLFELHVAGAQSGVLQNTLVSRTGVLERARHLVAAERAPLDQRRRAVGLLGILGDDQSVARLSRLASRQEFAHDAIQAMGAIADDRSMLELARRLTLRESENLSRHDQGVQATLCANIAKFGARGARLYLGRAIGEPTDDGRRFLRAAGYCQASEVLPMLAELLEKRDDLKVDAVSAIGSVGDATSVELLKKLLTHPDARVRRAAARVLRALGEASRRRSWTGYA